MTLTEFIAYLNETRRKPVDLEPHAFSGTYVESADLFTIRAENQRDIAAEVLETGVALDAGHRAQHRMDRDMAAEVFADLLGQLKESA